MRLCEFKGSRFSRSLGGLGDPKSLGGLGGSWGLEGLEVSDGKKAGVLIILKNRYIIHDTYCLEGEL